MLSFFWEINMDVSTIFVNDECTWNDSTVPFRKPFANCWVFTMSLYVLMRSLNFIFYSFTKTHALHICSVHFTHVSVQRQFCIVCTRPYTKKLYFSKIYLEFLLFKVQKFQGENLKKWVSMRAKQLKGA